MSNSSASDRIVRIRNRYQLETPIISIERAAFFTDEWKRQLRKGSSPAIRIAMAMNNVFRNMTHYVDQDDMIAGSWTENFLGVPVDVERGLFNDVLATELDSVKMTISAVKSAARLGAFITFNGLLPEVISNVKTMNGAPVPFEGGLKTMTERVVNRYEIRDDDKKTLLRKILPYWEGKTISEAVKKEVTKSGIYSEKTSEFVDALAATPSRQVTILSPESALCSYQGHLILDFERALSLGLKGLRKEFKEALDKCGESEHDRKDFLRSALLALDGVGVYAARLSGFLVSKSESEKDEARKAQLQEMARMCEKSPENPPETFREAVQAYWILKCASALANPTNVHAFGRLDRILYPYYRRDIENGAIGETEALELLNELLLKGMSLNIRPESGILGDFYMRFEGSEPVTMGGVNEDGEDATNELTYLLLRAAEESRSVINVVVRVHKDTPQELWMAAADALRKGASNISVMNDEIHIPALIRNGHTEEDARNYAVTGCTDVMVPGKTGSLSVTGLMLSKVLDMTLRNGDARTTAGTLKNCGIKTGTPEDFNTFEQLLDAFEKQLNESVRKSAAASDIRDKVFAEKMPAPFVSAFINGCAESGVDITSGGAPYDMSLMNCINSMANVIDSLYVIKKLVFDSKTISLKKLMKAVDSNFANNKKLLSIINNVQSKWGSGDPEANELAADVASRVFSAVTGRKTWKGGPWVPVINSMTSHTIDGRLSGATPDGRRAATPLASSCNPSNSVGGGMTGTLRSVASIDFSPVLGCSVNVKMHPSAIGESEETRNKWIALMKTYFALGGAQIQPTVVSGETLRKAQETPDEYRDVIVKVGGYSAYFVELGKEIQDEVISRAEHVN